MRSVSSLAGQADVEHDRGGALPEPVEVLVEERRVPVGDAQALPHPVAEHEAGVEDADDGLRARHERAVDVDQDVGVAGVVDEVVRAVRGGHVAIMPRQPKKTSASA